MKVFKQGEGFLQPIPALGKKNAPSGEMGGLYNVLTEDLYPSTGLPPAALQSSGVKLKASCTAHFVGALVKTRNSVLQQPGSFSNDLLPDKCQWPHINSQKALKRDASQTLEAQCGHCEGEKRRLSQICQYAASQSTPHHHPFLIYRCQGTAIICPDELELLADHEPEL